MGVTIPDESAVRRILQVGFSRSAVEKGLRYYSDGRVTSLEVSCEGDAWEIRGLVKGSEPKPYRVKASAVQDDPELLVDGECSCPVGIDCKHVVAVFAAASAREPRIVRRAGKLDDAALVARLERLSGKDESPGRRVAAQREEMPPELMEWSKRLGEAAAEGAAADEAADEANLHRERVHFVMALMEAGRASRVSVRVETSRPRKNGHGWTKAKTIDLSSKRPDEIEGIPAADRSLLKKLRGEIGGFWVHGAIELTGQSGGEVLAEIAATGRLRLEGKNGEALLSLGAPRRGELGWRWHGTGSQQTCVQTVPESTTILMLEPYWYLDAKRNELGVVELDRPARVVREWLSSPTVQPGRDAAVSQLLAPLGMPAPTKVEVVRRRDVACVPVLRLWGHQPLYWGRYYRQDNEVLPVGVATLSFDYDGQIVRGNDKGDTLESFRDGKLERIHRRKDVESVSVQAISMLLVRAGSAGSGLYLTEAGSHWVMGGAEDYGDMLTSWLNLVNNMLPALRSRGWRIEVDDSFPAKVVEAGEWFADAAEGGHNWFDVELGVMVDGKRTNMLPILSRLLRGWAQNGMDPPRDGQVYVRLEDGRYIKMDVSRLTLIRDVLQELLDGDSLGEGGKLRSSMLRAADISAVLGTSNTRWLGSPAVQELGRKIQGFKEIKAVSPPAEFLAELRPYQGEGVAWLQFLREFGLGGILADDMGLGKTVEALAHIVMEKASGRAQGPSLVVAPTSLMANWRREAERFAPGLKVLVLHGTGRKDDFEKISECDLVVTSYPLLNRDEEILKRHEFHLMILDEAQYIKNARASWAMVATRLKARHRVAMTGTPMENHLGELWSIMNFLLPGYLGDEKQFRRVFRTPIEKHQDGDARKALQRRIRPFLLRRRKEEVVKELPPKTEIVKAVDLAGGQRDLYETVRLMMEERVRAEIASKGLARSHIVVLDALLKLRQVCCDPRLVKLDAARKVKESGKLELLMDMVPEMISEGRRVLLFSQFTSMLDLIRERLDGEKVPYVLLTGSTTDRDTPVQAFQAGKVPLFLISLKAGGTGLNLTTADTVIHYDPWWNPAVEAQATDRAHRIGQDKNVFVYKLTTAGTVEEKILALQEKKRKLLEGVLGEETAVAKLSQEDLTELFAPIG